MDRKSQKLVRLKIGEILERKCGECENRSRSANYCVDCPIYSELRHYGRMIFKNKAHESEPKIVASKVLTKELLIELLDQGLRKRDIERSYNLSKNAVHRLIKRWDLDYRVNAPKSVIDKETYIAERNNGLTDLGIRKKHNVSWRTLGKKIESWGLENFVPDWQKPDQLTPIVYAMLKEFGWKNNEIDDLYGIKRRERERIVDPNRVIK